MKVIQSSVVRALVAIVVGVMLILYRKATLEWMVIITGALFFLSGCLSCLAYYWGRRKAIRAAQVIDEEGRVVGPHTPPLPIAGVGSVLLGLILMMMTGSFIRGVPMSWPPSSSSEPSTNWSRWVARAAMHASPSSTGFSPLSRWS